MSKATDLFWRKGEIRGREGGIEKNESCLYCVLGPLSADITSRLATMERLVFLYM